jgi:hypothetical protein
VTGPWAEDGRMPAMTDDERALIVQHERRIAVAAPRPGSIRVLAVIGEAGVWSVDLDCVDLTEEIREAGGDPTAVRFVIQADDDAFQHDLPVAVLRQIANRIREL